MSRKPKQSFSVRLPPETADQLKRVAAATDQTITEIVEAALETYFSSPFDRIINSPADMDRLVEQVTALIEKNKGQ
jgi:hypothetical protein